MENVRVAELAKMNEELRTDYLRYLRRLKAQAAATIADLEGTGEETPRDSAGILLFKAETNQRIIEQFQTVIRELDDIFKARANGHLMDSVNGEAD